MKTLPDFPLFVLSSLCSVFAPRRTVNCVWELTYRCNAQCSFCHYWKTPTNPQEELTLAEVHCGIDNVYRSGCRLINFSGGEPTLRDDLEDIVLYAAKKRIWTSVITNGSRLDSARIRDLRTAGLDNLFISIDFADGHAQDRHRNIDGLFERIMNSVTSLKTDFLGGHRTAGLMCVVSNSNLESAGRLTEIARRNGVFMFFQLYHPKKVDVAAFRIRDAKSIATTLLDLQANNRNVLSSRGYLEGMADSRKGRPCSAGRKYFSVDPLGYMHPCVDLPAMGHVLRDTVAVTRSPAAARSVESCAGCWYCFRGEADHALSLRGSLERIAQFGRIIWRGR